MTTHDIDITLHDDLITLDDYTVRPVTLDDVPAILTIINDCAIAETGAAIQTADEIRSELQTPGFDLATDTLAVVMPGGQFAGYAEYWNLQEPQVRPYLFGRVHPDFRQRGIGTFLLRWGEERTAPDVVATPNDVQFTLRAGVNTKNAVAQTLFEAEGYHHARSFYRMVIEMDAPPPAPVWPEGITVRVMTPTRENHRIVHATIEDAFSDHWGYLPVTFDKYMHWVENDPDFDPSLWFIAYDGDEIAGICLCRPHITEDPAMGWVDDLGVRRPWRRRGLGLALLQHAFGEFWRRGQRKVGLGVDASSLTGATRLYERAGMHVARQYDHYCKVLRPGRELSTQTVEE